MERRAKEAYNRYLLIKTILLEANDEEGIALLNDIVNQCERYVQKVIEHEMAVARGWKMYPAETAKERTQILDESRRRAHDALISKIKSFNRYLFSEYGLETKGGRIPVGGIYSLDPALFDRREVIADWAGFLVKALYEKGEIKS